MTFPSGTPLPLKLSIMYKTKIDNSKIVKINAMTIKLIVLIFWIIVFTSVFNIDFIFVCKKTTRRLTALTLTKTIRSD